MKSYFQNRAWGLQPRHTHPSAYLVSPYWSLGRDKLSHDLPTGTRAENMILRGACVPLSALPHFMTR